MKVVIWTILVFCCLYGYSQTGYDFKKADSVSSLYPKHSLTNLELLSTRLTNSLKTDIEKYRSIFQWVCANISNDYNLYHENMVKREKLTQNPEKLEVWKRSYRKRVFKELLDHHQTMCTGYAYLINELCRYAGIECVIINGYGRTITSNLKGKRRLNHSWNAVRINGKWWLSDATWSSGYIRSDSKAFVPLNSDDYFLVSPDLFWYNHYPEDTSWLLLKIKPTLDEFLQGPLVYRKAIAEGIIPTTPDLFSFEVNHDEPIHMKWSHLKKGSDHKIDVKVVKNGLIKTYSPQVTDQEISFNYHFERKGKYVIHLYIDDQVGITYEINVN